MEKENIAVGLDIGTTKIVAMIGKKNEYGKLEILGVGKSKSLGVARGVVNNITQTIQSIQQAVLEAENKSGYKIKSVVVGIAGQHIRSIQHSDYIIRKSSEEVIDDNDIQLLIEQVNKLAMLPGEEIIHVLPQEYKIDGQSDIKEPIGMYGGRLESSFHVVVGQASSIRNVARCIQSSDIELSGLTLEPLASANAVLSQEEKEAGVALIDIGGGTDIVPTLTITYKLYATFHCSDTINPYINRDLPKRPEVTDHVQRLFTDSASIGPFADELMSSFVKGKLDATNPYSSYTSITIG